MTYAIFIGTRFSQSSGFNPSLNINVKEFLVVACSEDGGEIDADEDEEVEEEVAWIWKFEDDILN